MFNNVYLKAALVRMALENPAEMVKMLERGDADSSGSTMRTAGVVALVLVIFGLIATAVVVLATLVGGKVKTPAF